MRFSMIFLGIILLLAACQQNKSTEKIEEVRVNPDFKDIIRNPIQVNKQIDSSELAVMEFEEKVFVFDTVIEGTIVNHTFNFKNTGAAPLLITNARSTCGCTVPHWPEKPIQPNEKGTIKVSFDTNDKEHQQIKPITIFANTLPSETVLKLKGVVLPK